MLTVPEKSTNGRENGFLQAWETFDQVRLQADFVVLSACQMGIGKESGAGVMRLFDSEYTNAFHSPRGFR